MGVRHSGFELVRVDPWFALGIGCSDLAHILVFLCREKIQAAQLAKSPDVVGEVLHPDLGFCSNQADSSHKGATHVVRLRTEHMFDPDTDR